MLIVEEIRKVYAENYQRSCSSLGFTVCLRERGRIKREGNSKNINLKRGEGRLFINCDIIGAFCLKWYLISYSTKFYILPNVWGCFYFCPLKSNFLRLIWLLKCK